MRIHFFILTSAIFLSITDTINAQENISPVVANLPSADPPAIPSGLKITCLTVPNALQSSTTCPVIMWNEYEYWVYSFVDNRDAMSIVAYTEDGTMVKRWDKTGARYISSISVNPNDKTIALVGQSSRQIVVKWDELYLPIPPEAGKVPSIAHPKIPDGSKMACMQSANVLGTMDTCWVLEWGDYTYWAYSYIDNRVAMNIVAYDANGNIVRQWEKTGARYLYNITVDPVGETVEFRGQADQKISMKWSELFLK